MVIFLSAGMTEELADAWGLDFLTLSAGELASVEGNFEESDFVRGVTGVGNVCERAAVLGAYRAGLRPGGKMAPADEADSGGEIAPVRLLAGKTAVSGATAAVAADRASVRIRFAP